MARRTVRKLDLTPVHGDDLHWPIDVALIVLGAFLLGTTLSFQQFDEPRWYANATTSLVGIPLFILVGMAVTRRVSRRWLRRSMQLGMLVSLLFHLVMLLITAEIPLLSKPWNQERTARDIVRQNPLRMVPDYRSFELVQRADQQPDFTQPVETEVPQPTPPDVETRESVQHQSPVEPQPQPVRDPRETVRPEIVKREQTNEIAPRRSEQASRLGRSLERSTPATARDVSDRSAPPATSASVADPEDVATPRTEVARQEPPAAPQRTDEEPAATPAVPDLPRRAALVEASGESPQSPLTLKRDPVAARLEPSLAAEQRVDSAERQLQPPVLAPAEVPVAQAAPRSTGAGRPEATAEPATEIASDSATRRTEVDRQPLTGQTPQPVPNHQPRRTERQLADAVESPAAASPAAGPPAVAPAITAIARREAPDPSAHAARAAAEEAAAPPRVAPNAATRGVADVARPSSETTRATLGRQATPMDNAPPLARLAESVAPARAPHSSPAGLRATDAPVTRQPLADAAQDGPRRQAMTEPRDTDRLQATRNVSRRPVAANVATLQPQAQPTDRPSRAAREAAPQSPQRADHPAVRVAPEAGSAGAQPSPLALARGTSGVAGSGYSSNLDRGAPAPESPAAVASGASRERATQVEPPGVALSPASRATVPRTRADGPSSNATASMAAARVGPGAVADSVGEAGSASAAAVSTQAKVETGDVSADRGQLDVDLGTQRVVSQFQSGRGAGGGREELSFSSQTSDQRPVRSGAAQPALAVDTTAQDVGAPAGDGGSRPLALDADPATTDAARTEPGGTDPASGAPAVAAAEGPAAEASLADTRGDVAVRRATNAAAGGVQLGTTLEVEDPSAANAPGMARQSLAAAPSQNQRVEAESSSQDAAAEGQPNAATRPDTPIVAAADLEAIGKSAATGGDDMTATRSAADLAPAGAAGEAPDTRRWIRRAEAADVPAGPPLLGGGDSGPPRSSRGQRPGLESLGTTVEAPAVASATGSEVATPLASGTEVERRKAGLSPALDRDAQRDSDPAALIATPAATRVRTGGPGDVERPATSGSSGPALSRQRPEADLAATGIESAADLPTVTVAESPTRGSDLAPAATASPAARSRIDSPSTTLADIDASPGDGGLAVVLTPDVGLQDRRARPDSFELQSRITRIPRNDAGGLPGINTAPIVATEAFRKRMERMGNGPSGNRLGPETEKSIELGLVFLARYQQEDGRWSLQGLDPERPAIESDVAATGLALLAFQGAGYTHQADRYATVVRGGLDFLIANQDGDGAVFAEADVESNRFARLYSHAIAALALCEAYGMTQDAALREPAQNALRYVLASQNQELGGWRYTPGYSSDTSVTGWMVMALKSGELAKLDVPPEAYQRVVGWLDRAQASGDEPYLYRYNPDAPDTATQRHGRSTTPTMTAVGLLMRLYTGWKRDNANLRKGADYLAANLPGTSPLDDPVVSRRRDTYYWYYATQVMFHMGGEHCRAWNGQLHPLLVESQVQTGPLAGSWDPLRPVPDRWAGHAGRLYVTAMNLLSLEVTYRHLPIYDDTAK